MAIQLSTGVRNARLDAIETTGGASCSLEIRSGAPPANCAAARTGTILATMNLPSDWLAAASGGSKAIAGTWQDLTADNAGTAGHFCIYSSQATKDGTTCIMQGTITATSGGGDMEIDNTSISAGQQVTVTAFTLTDANA